MHQWRLLFSTFQIDSGIAVLENEKIERHIMKSVPGGHNLFVPDKEIEKKIENLYNKFKMMILRKDESSKLKVNDILQRINDTLRANGTRFLIGEICKVALTTKSPRH